MTAFALAIALAFFCTSYVGRFFCISFAVSGAVIGEVATFSANLLVFVCAVDRSDASLWKRFAVCSVPS